MTADSTDCYLLNERWLLLVTSMRLPCRITVQGQFRPGSPSGWLASSAGLLFMPQPRQACRLWAKHWLSTVPVPAAQTLGQWLPPSPLLAGYGVLHYKDADEALPATKAPQPGSVQPWTFEQEAQIVMSSALLQVGRANSHGLQSKE